MARLAETREPLEVTLRGKPFVIAERNDFGRRRPTGTNKERFARVPDDPSRLLSCRNTKRISVGESANQSLAM